MERAKPDVDPGVGLPDFRFPISNCRFPIQLSETLSNHAAADKVFDKVRDKGDLELDASKIHTCILFPFNRRHGV